MNNETNIHDRAESRAAVRRCIPERTVHKTYLMKIWINMSNENSNSLPSTELL